MAIGRKTGGRQLGSLNKRTREVAEICGTLGYNPVEAMIRIALDPAAPLDLRAKMHAELAPYLYAKPTKALSASFSAVPDIVILTTTEPPPRGQCPPIHTPSFSKRFLYSNGDGLKKVGQRTVISRPGQQLVFRLLEFFFGNYAVGPQFGQALKFSSISKPLPAPQGPRRTPRPNQRQPSAPRCEAMNPAAIPQITRRTRHSILRTC